MADTTNPGDKKLSDEQATLTLKPRVETGTVRQSFPHGRTKQVVVEKRGKRRIGGDGPEVRSSARTGGRSAKPACARHRKGSARPARRQAQPSAPPRNASGVVLHTLTEDEHAARVSALADARVREVEERRIAEEEAKRRASREGIEQAEREAAEARRKAEEDRHRADEDAKRKAELEAKKRFGEAEAAAAASARPAAAAATTSTATPATRAPAARAPAARTPAMLPVAGRRALPPKRTKTRVRARFAAAPGRRASGGRSKDHAQARAAKAAWPPHGRHRAHCR